MGALDKHVHFVLVAIALHGDHQGQMLARKAAQARLRIGNPHAVENLEHRGGDAVAVAAFEGHVRLGEIAAAQKNAFAVLGHALRHAQHVLYGMLAVAVSCDHILLLRAFIQHVLHAALEGHALAAVGHVGDDVRYLILRNAAEQLLKALAASIVHNHNFADACGFQRLHIGRKPVVRLISRDNNCRFFGEAHVLTSFRKAISEECTYPDNRGSWAKDPRR